MDSVMIAQFLGLVFTVLGLGLLFNQAHTVKVINDVAKHPASQLMFGILPLLLGGFIIVTHNDWREGWSLVVTLVGWMLFFAAMFRLWMVENWVGMMKKYGNCVAMYGGIAVTALGAILLYIGFIVD